MKLPQISIHQQYAKIGIDADLGQFRIRQPRGTLEIEQIPAKLHIRQPRGELIIDQSRAWDALGRTNILKVMDRIYDQARVIALEAIAKIAQKGDRLAKIHIKTDPIPEMAREVTVSFPEFQYAGEASFDNVDIFYKAHWPEIKVEPGGVRYYTQVNPPQIEYIRGKLDIYIRQWNSLEIIPPQIDIRI